MVSHSRTFYRSQSVIARGLLEGIADRQNYVPVFINFSAQTGSMRTQEMIESKLEKRRKNVLGEGDREREGGRQREVDRERGRGTEGERWSGNETEREGGRGEETERDGEGERGRERM